LGEHFRLTAAQRAVDSASMMILLDQARGTERSKSYFKLPSDLSFYKQGLSTALPKLQSKHD
jgi:hypothetical protein